MSSEPLHIQLSPTVIEGDVEKAHAQTINSALVYGVMRPFIHTDVDQITVTVIPRVLGKGGRFVGTLDEKKRTIRVSREKALETLRSFFPGKSFNDLVSVQELPDMSTELFNRILHPDQGSPGIDAFLRKLAE